MVILLLVRFKRDTGVQNHLQAVINNTSSRFEVRWWLELLNGGLGCQNQKNGPELCDEEVKLSQSLKYQETFVY